MRQKAWDVADQLVRLIQGRHLVQFLAEEHLRDMTLEASARLGSLTGRNSRTACPATWRLSRLRMMAPGAW
jgi:hypothetical protein